MSIRTSRIQHPPGSRFIQVHEWLVKLVGKPAATVVAALDFLDRAQDKPGQPLASRARLIADLEGFVGKGAIDEALQLLVGLGWVKRFENTRPGKNNLITTVDYGLVATEINESIKNQEQPELPESGVAGTPSSGAGTGPDSGTTLYMVRNRKEQQQEAAVVVFDDGSSIPCRPEWQDDLMVEVDVAFSRPDPPEKDRGSYAAGILKNWEKAGAPSGTRKKKAVAVARQAEAAASLEACRAAGDALLLSQAAGAHLPIQKTVQLKELKAKAAERAAAASP